MSRFNFRSGLAALFWMAASAAVAAAPASSAPDKKADGDSEKSEGGKFEPFKPETSVSRTWNFQHQMPGQPQQPASARQGSNVMPDLANAMKINPNLKIQLHAGYFDLATPFYQGVYEMHHLPIPASLQANIEYKFYDSGHMVYAKDSSLRLLHDNVAQFIRRTSNSAR